MLGEFFVKLEAQLLHMRVDIGLSKNFFLKKMDLLQSAIFEFQKHAIQIQDIIQVNFIFYYKIIFLIL